MKSAKRKVKKEKLKLEGTGRKKKMQTQEWKEEKGSEKMDRGNRKVNRKKVSRKNEWIGTKK